MKNLEKKGSSIKIGQILKHFWRGIRPNKWFFVLGAGSYFVSNLLYIFVPTLYKKFFDVLGLENKTESIESAFSIIVKLLILNLLVWGLWRSGDFFYNTVMVRISSLLRQHIFDYTSRHSYTFFANNMTGGFMAKANRFTMSFEMISHSFVYNFLSLITVLSGSIIVTWFVSPLTSMTLLVWVIVFASFNILFSRWKLKYDVKVSEANSANNSYLADTITNNNAVSLFTAHNFESTEYRKLNLDFSKKSLVTLRLGDATDAIQTLLVVIVEFFIFYFLLKDWGLGLISIGTFVMAQTYIISISQQLWGLNRIIRTVYHSFADAKEMVEILETPYEIQDVPNASELKVSKGEIVMKNISFKFSENKEVLKDLNLTIKAGEKVGLVGPSGAGKTTFVRLIMRLYDLTGGAIEIDGQNIHNATQDSLRANISLVPQDPVLFHRTLMENIRYGRRDATDEEVKEAARLAHCDEFIESLPLKYETFVGERGIKLSGGERQRVAIARAILKKAPILILDEATSSLDSHSELLIQDALDNLMKNCTTIVIAHRLSTIKKMDRIIAMKDGKIVEEGTHDELTNKDSGLYKTLWDLQAGGFVA